MEVGNSGGVRAWVLLRRSPLDLKYNPNPGLWGCQVPLDRVEARRRAFIHPSRGTQQPHEEGQHLQGGGRLRLNCAPSSTSPLPCIHRAETCAATPPLGYAGIPTKSALLMLTLTLTLTLTLILTNPSSHLGAKALSLLHIAHEHRGSKDLD